MGNRLIAVQIPIDLRFSRPRLQTAQQGLWGNYENQQQDS
jgi:hypothetical protein